ncbi:MAG: DegV family protein [Clostridia bacterium]|jgi:DegV family protein with EDD domain|nr:DegV family protein [Clostridia bacterium]
MSYFEIFTDGAADIPLKTAKSKGINIIPFYISFDGNTYLKELKDLSLEIFYNKILDEGLFPKTSLPSVNDYIDAFTPTLKNGKDVICFTITHTLSGSVQSARAAADILNEKYSSKIYVINSFLATGAQQLLIYEAMRMRDLGLSAEIAFKLCEKCKKTGRIMFIVGSLAYFEKGGRIGKLAALSGSILKIKPLIELKNAEVNVGGVARSRKNGLKKLVEMTSKYFSKYNEFAKDYTFIAGTTNNWNEMPEFEDILCESIVPRSNLLSPFQIGATIAAHTGPDTTGICFLKKYDRL